MDNNDGRETAPSRLGDDLVVLQTVLTEAEGQIICELLNSGGIAALLHNTQLSGYGMLRASFNGSAGEVMVYERDLVEARNFIRLWQAPLLEESEAPAE